MTFKTRVIFSFGLFVFLVAGLGAGLMVNSRRVEMAFREGRNALRAQFMAQEIDYFVNRKIRSVETYVMFGEELERYSIEEADSVLNAKFGTWDRWVRAKDDTGVDLAQLRNIDQGLRAVEDRVRGLMDSGRKSQAMGIVGGEYRDLVKKAREKLKDVTARKVGEALESERTMYRVVRQSHFTSIAAVLMAMLLGIVLAVGLHNSVMLPMKVFSMWSEQMAKGHLHVSLNIPGNDEMSRLAKNFNEMVHALSENHQRMEREKDLLAKERELDIAREREMETELRRRREEQEKEEVSTLEDAVDGFREILDIMGAAPSSAREKKK